MGTGHRWRAAWAVMTALLLALGGCESSQAQRLRQAQAHYQAGRYMQAYEGASMIATIPAASRETREEAGYLAGSAAYRLRDAARAEGPLRVAAGSRDPQLRSRAQAMLGLIYTQRGDYESAAHHLSAAAEHLSGQDRANAYYYAGLAQQRLGRWPTARSNLSLALSGSQDPDFRRQVADALRVTGYTLQVGAFSQEDNARKAAADIAVRAQQMRLGLPRVVPAADPGGRGWLYLAQVGEFSSWPTAVSARQGLGVNAIVVPLSR